METKVCSRCGEEKPLSAYNKNRSSRDGHKADCRQCEKEGKLKRRQADRALAKTGKTKVCTECGEEKLLTEFYRDRRREDGRQAKCKKCRKDLYGKDKGIWNWPTCKYCGDDLDVTERRDCCSVCAKKAILWRSGSRYVYLCTVDPGYKSPYKGGHFFSMDMRGMLKEGYWEEGTEFERWRGGKYQGYYRVKGEQLTPQELVEVEGVEAKGDGRFLRVV